MYVLRIILIGICCDDRPPNFFMLLFRIRSTCFCKYVHGLLNCRTRHQIGHLGSATAGHPCPAYSTGHPSTSPVASEMRSKHAMASSYLIICATHHLPSKKGRSAGTPFQCGAADLNNCLGKQALCVWSGTNSHLRLLNFFFSDHISFFVLTVYFGLPTFETCL